MNDEQTQSAQRLTSHLFNGRTDLGFVGFGKTSSTQIHKHFIVYCYGKWHGEVITKWEGVDVIYREGMSPIKPQSL